MADLDPDNISGKSPRFMTQGWHGHKAVDMFATDQDPEDNSNCRVPSFDSEVEKEGY